MRKECTSATKVNWTGHQGNLTITCLYISAQTAVSASMSIYYYVCDYEPWCWQVSPDTDALIKEIKTHPVMPAEEKKKEEKKRVQRMEGASHYRRKKGKKGYSWQKVPPAVPAKLWIEAVRHWPTDPHAQNVQFQAEHTQGHRTRQSTLHRTC